MDILPDSRLRAPKATKFAVWQIDGRNVSVELEPVYCANCGAEHGYVPRRFTSFAFWLCDKCFEQWGKPAGVDYVSSDQAFWRRVEDAMREEFGRVLTRTEVQVLADQGYGVLASLVRESPYRKER